jgi:hypothetical protein
MFKALIGFAAGTVLAAMLFLIVGEAISVVSPHPGPGYVPMATPSYERP